MPLHPGQSAKNGPLMIDVGKDAQPRRLCETIGPRDIVDDPDCATHAQRVTNFDRTVAHLQEFVVPATVQE